MVEKKLKNHTPQSVSSELFVPVRIIIVAVLTLTATASAQTPVALKPDKLGDVRIEVSDDGSSAVQRIPLKTPTPPILSLRLEKGDNSGGPVPYLVFNSDATDARVEFTEPVTAKRPVAVLLETHKGSGQLADGRIVFSAADAAIDGPTAKLESHPGNDRIGFWTSLDDRVIWNYEATRPGSYTVDLTYSLSGNETSKIELQLGRQSLKQTLTGTESWYRYRTVALGPVRIPATGRTQLSVQGLEKSGAAVMNLKSVVLRPAPEGKPIAQGDDGIVVCHARDVTIHGVKVQYEPRPVKNTVGYWTNPKDWVSWDFKIRKPGRFEVEVLQGCGKGHGGSRVSVFVNGEKLTFTVEDTGHFQNFKPRIVGTVTILQPGVSTLKIVPIDKKSVAVMDVRQVRLIPVK